jgi:two-component system, NtrC family, sensor kinase
VIKNYQNIVFITNYKNEFIQSILNIINNSKDALDEQNNKNNRLLFINVEKLQDSVKIVFKDNAGGIPTEIMSRIFEPYFTTKHKSQGTGLGLYMTYKIITESMKGSLSVSNVEYVYNNTNYIGAEFIILLPLLNDNLQDMKDEETNV